MSQGGITVEVDTKRFDAAVRSMLRDSKRDIRDFLNNRLFFVLLRVFVLTPPKNIQQERTRVSNYLGAWIVEKDKSGRYFEKKSKKTGKKLGRNRVLKRVNLIVNARLGKMGQPGLSGKLMAKVSGKFWRGAVNSVGYLKSVSLKAIKHLSPGFAQFGFAEKKNKKTGVTLPRRAGNAALIATAKQYDAEMRNVGLFKGVTSITHKAEAMFNARASARLRIGLADDQSGRVDAIMQPVIQKALNDEAAEMEAHMAGLLTYWARSMDMAQRTERMPLK